MSKLEPTRTSSDLTATERLRRMLDERGVEHYDGTESTLWGYEDYNEFTGIYRFSADETSDGYMQVRLWRVTPEQAIAATLCATDARPTQEESSETCLPHFWTHDGTLHIEATRMPTRIVVCEGGTCEFVPKRELDASEDENAKLRELVWDLYCLAYPSTVEWEVSDETYDKYSPCEKCQELHGGKSPCASTAKDMTEECCAPIQANIVADRMRELGVEVD